jgi:hypothetical protein
MAHEGFCAMPLHLIASFSRTGPQYEIVARRVIKHGQGVTAKAVGKLEMPLVGFHAVEFGQVEIEHHLLIAEDRDALLGLDGGGVLGHGFQAAEMNRSGVEGRFGFLGAGHHSAWN